MADFIFQWIKEDVCLWIRCRLIYFYIFFAGLMVGSFLGNVWFHLQMGNIG